MRLKTEKFLLQFTVNIIIYFLIAVTIHEYGHWLTNIVLGGKGYIKGFYTYITAYPADSWKIAVVKLMGGWSVTIIYSVLYIFCEDVEEKTALFIWLMYSLFDGLGEMLGLRWIALIGASIGIFVALFLWLLSLDR